ncbi:hypothetical protein [Haladaptatus sp. CMSO5]|uniref:hypothetical protein n=1 Tax=Haladaptatus sp. CMSO5 TaxID=3120514 RepID=UPI002FCE17F8
MIERFPTANENVAYSVVQRLQQFIREFSTRSTDPGRLDTLIRGGDFRGGIVRQKPEFFTEQYLIVPILEGLGFESIRWRPVNLIKNERKQPDFEIDDPPTNSVCIVEAKRLGLEQSKGIAEQQVKKYLASDTFVKYGTDLNCEYLVGIGTDGIDWTVYAKEVGQSKQKCLATASIKEELRKLALADRHETESPKRLVQKTRNSIEESLVAGFAKHNISRRLVEEF